MKNKLLLLSIFIIIFFICLQVLAEVNFIRIEMDGGVVPVILTGKQAKQFFRAYQKSTKVEGKYCVNAPYKIIISSRISSLELRFWNADQLYLPRKNKIVLPTEEFRTILSRYYSQMKRERKYGELLSWTAVNKLFTRYTYAWIEDLETGMRFGVQRRAGSQHADVQPLTAEDTEIMKTIYNGQWSWQRKAVIVEIGNQKIAASMNGMPHGSGKISNNNFKGHFCVHFLNSKTHSHNKVDIAHQLMVWKSAGRTEEFIGYSKPDEIVSIFFTALEQKELNLALKILDREIEQIQLKSWLKNKPLLQLDRITPIDLSEDTTKIFKIDLVYGLTGESGNRGQEIIIIVKQDKDEVWRIDASFLKLID